MKIHSFLFIIAHIELKITKWASHINLRIQWVRVRAAPGALALTPMDENPPLELIRLLLARLERISADSYWAHRASGVRGSLLKALGDLEGQNPSLPKSVEMILEQGLYILDAAAKERIR